MKTVALNYETSGRTHSIRFKFSNHLDNIPIIEADIPTNISHFDENLFENMTWQNSMYETFAEFKRIIQKYQRYFSLIDEIRKLKLSFTDRLTLAYTDTEFRLNLSDGVFVTIKMTKINQAEIKFLNPLHFIGSKEKISGVREKIESVFQSSAVRLTEENIIQFLRIFENELENMETDEEKSCGICYQFDLEGLFPHLICQNTQCSKLFHNPCYEMLSDGKCPYCDSHILPNIL